MLVVSHPTATATELTQPPTSNWVLSSPPHSTAADGEAGECPKPSKLLLQENIQPPSTNVLRQQSSSPAWQQARAGQQQPVGNPSPRCPGKEGQGQCVCPWDGCTAPPPASSPPAACGREKETVSFGNVLPSKTLCRRGCAALKGERLSLEKLPTECQPLGLFILPKRWEMMWQIWAKSYPPLWGTKKRSPPGNTFLSGLPVPLWTTCLCKLAAAQLTKSTCPSVIKK